MLSNEKRSIEDQYRALQEQMRLVDSHLASLESKEKTIATEEAEDKARMELLDKTLQGLLLEVDKYRVLAGNDED